MKVEEMGVLRKENVLIPSQRRAFFPLWPLYATDSPDPTVFFQEPGIADFRRIDSSACRWQAYA